jgi:hypothetical protein
VLFSYVFSSTATHVLDVVTQGGEVQIDGFLVVGPA